MIFSSVNILEILNGSEIIRLSASEISIVDKKPIASGREGFFVYIERYPTVDEFEATWKIWIESDGSEPDDLLFQEMRRLLPGFSFKLGLIIEATVKDFKSEKTEIKPDPSRALPVAPPSGWDASFEKKFEELREDIQDRMLLVGPGRPGRDGKDGLAGPAGPVGPAGRDGKDLVSTSAVLDDLIDVSLSSRIPLQKGQVLTYNGDQWENLFVPQVQSISGGGGGGNAVPTGPNLSVGWIYDTVVAEPPEKNFNTAGVSDVPFVTEFHVSKTDGSGRNIELLLDAVLPITSKLYVSSQENASNSYLFEVTSYVENTDSFCLYVTYVESQGTETAFVLEDRYEILFVPGEGGGAQSIDELTDVDTSTAAPAIGQTLVWDGVNWVPGDSSDGIGEAPIDDRPYVRMNGKWILLEEALVMLAIGNGGNFSPMGDGGNFTTGYSNSGYAGSVDAGSVGGPGVQGFSEATEDGDFFGGYWS